MSDRNRNYGNNSSCRDRHDHGDVPRNLASERQQNSSTAEHKTTDRNLFMYINAIILQYMEVLGLSDSYSIFHKECHESGYPLPPRLSTSKPPDDSGVKIKDVDRLMKYFDDEKTHSILEKWESIVAEDPSSNKDLSKLKLNINLRVYAYITVPHRNRSPKDDKHHSMQLLLDYFKTNVHEDISDPEILSLYALPFVPDPTNHPIFCKFFKKSWIVNLRSTLRSYCLTLCQPTVDPLDTDIGKLYMLWSHTMLVMNDCLFDLRCPIPGGMDNMKLTSTSISHSSIDYDLPKNTPFRTFFDAFYKLREENEALKRTASNMKNEYLKKIQLCNALVTCLRELYSSRNEAEETDSRKRIFDIYSHFVAPNVESEITVPKEFQEKFPQQKDSNPKSHTTSREPWGSERNSSETQHFAPKSYRENDRNYLNQETQVNSSNKPYEERVIYGNPSDDRRRYEMGQSASNDSFDITDDNLGKCTLLLGLQTCKLFNNNVDDNVESNYN